MLKHQINKFKNHKIVVELCFLLLVGNTAKKIKIGYINFDRECEVGSSDPD